MILELCKGVHCVDLGESFQTHIYLQNLASIQPRTSPFEFARSPRTDPPGHAKIGTTTHVIGLTIEKCVVGILVEAGVRVVFEDLVVRSCGTGKDTSE